MSQSSVDILLDEAERQGWLPERTLSLIPEIAKIYQDASTHFFIFIDDGPPQFRETLVFHACRYLFAKGVEGVILWGPAPQGQISVYFHRKHLLGEMETEVPPHLHELVLSSRSVGESLFQAHQAHVMSCQREKKAVNLRQEIKTTLEWMPKLGISYALFHKYQALP